MDTGVIGGITVGAVVGSLLLIGTVAFYCCAKKQIKRRDCQRQAQSQQRYQFASVPELQSEELTELSSDQRWELHGEPVVARHEKDGTSVAAELPGDGTK